MPLPTTPPCACAGIVTSINSDNEGGTYHLNREAARCMKYGGLTEAEALKLVTINPAIQLGIDRRTGSLDTGKDADIAVWEGHPFSTFSKCVLTLVEASYFSAGTPSHRQTGNHRNTLHPCRSIP